MNNKGTITCLNDLEVGFERTTKVINARNQFNINLKTRNFITTL